ncbi:MAG: pilus assembly protein TadG-related protein, partial [Gaiellaceae bacterium]
MTQHAPRSFLGLRSDPSAQHGQALVLIVLTLTVLLGAAAFVIDVGYTYYAHRALQADADAAALAGAQALPDPSQAAMIAHQYTGAAGGKNRRVNLPTVNASVTTKCLSTV